MNLTRVLVNRVPVKAEWAIAPFPSSPVEMEELTFISKALCCSEIASIFLASFVDRTTLLLFLTQGPRHAGVVTQARAAESGVPGAHLSPQELSDLLFIHTLIHTILLTV